MAAERVASAEPELASRPPSALPVTPVQAGVGGNAAFVRAMQEDGAQLPPAAVTALLPGGNAALARQLSDASDGGLLSGAPGASLLGAGPQPAGAGGPVTAAAKPGPDVAFVRKEGLGLFDQPDPGTSPTAVLPFGQRLHVLAGSPDPTWSRVAAAGRVGFVDLQHIHFPPASLIQRDPALTMIKVPPDDNFWDLVRRVYGIRGNEGDADQNINHFINAVRAVNDPQAFRVKTDTLDDVGNVLVPGRDASDTELIANVDLWIPSFGVAAAMDVGSGTVTGEMSRLVKKVQQKVADFAAAGAASGKYVPAAVARHAGATAEGLVDGLIAFAKDAAKILATSTAVGALVGALFGGVGAVPGAEIGFEIGVLILQAYGLYELLAAILEGAGALLGHLAQFVSLAWNANGDKKQIEAAGMALAEALGTLASAILLALAAYVLHKSAKALSETRFGKLLGPERLFRWLEERKRLNSGTPPPERQLGAGETPKPPVNEPSTTTPKSPPPPPRQLSEATTQDIAQLKAAEFVLDKMSPDGLTATYRNPITNERVIVTLRQGGPSWVKPTWGRNRLEAELRDRGFTLDRPTKAEGRLYRNAATGEEVRIMDRPGSQNRVEPIEKHLNESYYRYKPGPGKAWGDHTTIPDKE